MLNPNYIMRKVVIDKATISSKLFKINEEERRNIREGSVKKLTSLLESKKHFSSPFVTNEITSTLKQNLIDGNHRYEAIKRVIASNPNFSITIWIAVYRDLTDAEEKLVYKEWNIGVPQSATDFLKHNFRSIPYGEQMLRQLPVSIYGNSNKLSIKNLVGCHIDSSKNKKFSGGYGAGKEQTLFDFQHIDPNDIESISEFCEFMIKIFGKYDKKNNYTFYATTPLAVFHRIWYDNRDISDNRIENAFKRTFAQHPEAWKDQIKSGGRGGAKLFYINALSALNRVHTSLHFKDDIECLEIRKKAEENKNKELKILNIVKTKLKK